MSDAWRCFIAIPLPPSLAGGLAGAIVRWRQHAAVRDLRWIEPDGAHLTVAFLGETRPETIDAVTSAMRSVASAHPACRLSTGGIGAFPSAARARVVWYGVNDPEGSLAALATDLHRTLGLELHGPYRPHVTLARARHHSVGLTEWLREASAPSGWVDVDRLELLRSHLGRGPARYERLATADLGAAVHV